MDNPLFTKEDLEKIFEAFARSEIPPTDSIYKGLAEASGLPEDEMRAMYSEAWNNVPRGIPFVYHKG